MIFLLSIEHLKKWFLRWWFGGGRFKKVPAGAVQEDFLIRISNWKY
jgi:hypothetical protein